MKYSPCCHIGPETSSTPALHAWHDTSVNKFRGRERTQAADHCRAGQVLKGSHVELLLVLMSQRPAGLPFLTKHPCMQDRDVGLSSLAASNTHSHVPSLIPRRPRSATHCKTGWPACLQSTVTFLGSLSHWGKFPCGCWNVLRAGCRVVPWLDRAWGPQALIEVAALPAWPGGVQEDQSLLPQDGCAGVLRGASTRNGGHSTLWLALGLLTSLH